MAETRLPPTSDHMVKPIWHVVVLIVLATLTIGLYSTSMPIPFLYDDAMLPWNTQLYSVFGPHTGVINDIPYPFRGRYVVSFLTAVNVAITGMTPGGLRVGNILIYLLCGGLLYRVVFRALCDAGLKREAFFVTSAACLLWLLHPLNNEAVFYITQRTGLLMMFFGLSTLALAQVSFASVYATRWQLAAVMACLLGMMCKENMAAIPVLVLLYDRAWVRDTWKMMWRKRGWWYGLLFATVLVPVGTLLAMDRSAGVGTQFGLPWWHYLLTQTVVVTWYFTRVVWPTDLWIHHQQLFVSHVMQVWPYAMLMVVLLGGSVWLVIKRPKVGFVAAVVFLVLAPTSSVIPIVAQPVADRRMLVPLSALLVLLTLGLWRLLNDLALRLCAKRSHVQETGAVFCFLVIVAAGALSLVGYVHMQRYQTARLAWEAIHSRYPESSTALTNLSWEYNQAKLYEKSLPIAQKLTQLYPQNANGWGNYAYALHGTGRGEQALRVLDEQIAKYPDKWRLHDFKAKLLEDMGRIDEATASLWAAYLIDPSAKNLAQHTNFLMKQGRSDKVMLARWHHQGLDVNTASQRIKLAQLLLAEQMYTLALEQAQAALDFSPTPQEQAQAQQLIQQAAQEIETQSETTDRS